MDIDRSMLHVSPRKHRRRRRRRRRSPSMIGLVFLVAMFSLITLRRCNAARQAPMHGFVRKEDDAGERLTASSGTYYQVDDDEDDFGEGDVFDEELDVGAYSSFELSYLLPNGYGGQAVAARDSGSVGGNGTSKALADDTDSPADHHDDKMFQPLSCNDGIDEADCTATPLSFFINATAKNKDVVIPCGVCAYWEDEEDDLLLPNSYKLNRGLNVIGKLHVPSTSGGGGTLRATHVFVQGVLSIDPPVRGRVVRILLRGKKDRTFKPHGENGKLCPNRGCDVGRKPFVVAGGLLDVRGVDHTSSPDGECPSWVNLLDIVAAPPDDEDDDGERRVIVVGESAASCWDVGDEILITSPTNSDSKQVTAIIESKTKTTGKRQGADTDTYDALVLTEKLPNYFDHATVVDDPDFAVEVARLRRRVIFEAEDDDPDTNDGLIGGHLIVLHTSNVRQRLEGVELRNFGQQGNLGRYPIHFHMCGNVSGSVISHNVILRSNQRCIVVHGTHDVMVENNVALDPFGHCFFTEDGIETGNTFRRNLGSGIRPPKHRIPNDDAKDETPAVFWITNPQNHWIDNVAAGSSSTGFWFDTRPNVRGLSLAGNEDYKPRHLPIGTFEGNVAKCSARRGIALYSPGWQPSVESVLRDSRVYRNSVGFFVHGNRNVAIVGGVVADHSIVGMQNFRASDIRLDGIRFVGYSENYVNVRRSCPSSDFVGMMLHTYRNIASVTTRGVDASNLEFHRYGAEETGCSRAKAIEFSVSQIKSFSDTPNRFRGVKFVIGGGDDADADAGVATTRRIDACPALSWDIDNISVEDVDGTLGTSTGVPGFLVSEHDAMTTFAGECVQMEGSCLAFCEHACLRQVTLMSNNAPYIQGIEMVISNGTHSAVDRWHRYYQSYSEQQFTFAFWDSRFVATLPSSDDIFIFFRDVETQRMTWPDFVEEHHEEAPLCADHWTSVTILRPPPTWERCADLIKGGKFHDGMYGAWQQRGATLGVTPAGDAGDTHNYALHVTNRENAGAFASQYLDVSCFVAGRMYNFTADIRLQVDGTDVLCDPTKTKACPIVSLTLFHHDEEDESKSASSDYSLTLAEIVSATRVDGWYKMQGSVILSEQDALARKALLHISQPGGVDYIIDNVSMKAVTESTTPCSDNCDQSSCRKCEEKGLKCCLDTGVTICVMEDACPFAYCECAS